MAIRYLAGISCLALVACGGSGSGTSDSAPPAPPAAVDIFANAAPIPPGGAIPVAGAAFQAEGQAVQTVMVANRQPGAFSGPFDAELVSSSSSRGGPADALRFTVDGATVTVDLVNVIAVGGGQAGNTLFIQIPETDLDLDFTVFGGWSRTSGPAGLPGTGDTVAFGAFGAPTPAAQLPTGDVTYTGRSVGLAEVGSRAGLTTSNVEVSVQNGFTNVTLSSTGTVHDPLDSLLSPSSEPSLDFTATGTIAGNGYTAAGGGMQASGNFYGPAGEETSGVFRGTIAGGSNYGGSFGARR